MGGGYGDKGTMGLWGLGQAWVFVSTGYRSQPVTCGPQGTIWRLGLWGLF